MLTSRTHARHIQNACKNVSGMHAHEMHPKCVRDASVQVQNLGIKLQQDLINCHALFCHEGCILNVCGTCLGCITGTFQMRVNVILELSRTTYTDNRKVPNTVTCWQVKSSSCLYSAPRHVLPKIKILQFCFKILQFCFKILQFC